MDPAKSRPDDLTRQKDHAIQRPRPFRFVTCAALVAIALLPSTSAALQAADDLLPYMPRVGDYTTMCWAHGALQFLGMTTPPPDAVLCLHSGSIGIALDTATLKFVHAGHFARTIPIDAALRCGPELIQQLPALPLELSVQSGAEKYICTGRGPLSNDPFRFPVQFIDSGHFFQHFSIEGLEFTNSSGVKLKAKARVEFAFWPDRLTLTASIIPTTDTALSGDFTVTAGDRRASVSLQDTHYIALPVFEPVVTGQATLDTPDAGVRAQWDDAAQCHVVHLPDRPSHNSLGTPYPSDELDRLEKWRVTLSNDSDAERVATLIFVPDHFQLAVGVTALLCDPDGTPTGIPVQLSKNWHAQPKLTDVQHQGPWFHGCTLVHVPPHARREFVFEMAYARYGGIPAASHAQLSLLGWAHNQFWDEAAIGCFGESACFEPGRVQRRCFIDDLRPLLTYSHPGSKRYGWSGNCGGGDFLMWIDACGDYQSARATQTDYRACGPCLTNVQYAEQTRGGELFARMSVSLERSDDYVRVLQHLHYEVRKPMTWQRLAFYQLGADHYNSTPATRVAIGNSGGLCEEWSPPAGSGAYQHRAIPLPGPNPWISIHGADPVKITPGNTGAARGLIVRSWNAILGGRKNTTPHLSVFVRTDVAGPRTILELSPPPDVTRLLPGDVVDADLELLVFPADVESYYGPNETFRQALKSGANSWALTQREACGNALDVDVDAGSLQQRYPLTIRTDASNRAAAHFRGGIGFVPVIFTGLQTHRAFELLIDGKPLNQAVHGNDFWQTDYDPASREWSITYNIPQPAGLTSLEFNTR